MELGAGRGGAGRCGGCWRVRVRVKGGMGAARGAAGDGGDNRGAGERRGSPSRMARRAQRAASCSESYPARRGCEQGKAPPSGGRRQPRRWGGPRKHIADGPKGVASGGRRQPRRWGAARKQIADGAKGAASSFRLGELSSSERARARQGAALRGAGVVRCQAGRLTYGVGMWAGGVGGRSGVDFLRSESAGEKRAWRAAGGTQSLKTIWTSGWVSCSQWSSE
jgi:hypothetical protein